MPQTRETYEIEQGIGRAFSVPSSRATVHGATPHAGIGRAVGALSAAAIEAGVMPVETIAAALADTPASLVCKR
jgi:hypothetical protein